MSDRRLVDPRVGDVFIDDPIRLEQLRVGSGYTFVNICHASAGSKGNRELGWTFRGMRGAEDVSEAERMGDEEEQTKHEIITIIVD